MAGYSGTPLAKKLGIKPGYRVRVEGAPGHYADLLAPLPEGAGVSSRYRTDVDIYHVFATARRTLSKRLGTLARTMRPDAAVWVSWPKKSSGVPSDVSEDVIRAIALPLGMVDVKVCAVDETWSGLKLVIRKALRG